MYQLGETAGVVVDDVGSGFVIVIVVVVVVADEKSLVECVGDVAVVDKAVAVVVAVDNWPLLVMYSFRSYCERR